MTHNPAALRSTLLSARLAALAPLLLAGALAARSLGWPMFHDAPILHEIAR